MPLQWNVSEAVKIPIESRFTRSTVGTGLITSWVQSEGKGGNHVTLSGVSKRNFPAPGAVQGRFLPVSAYEEPDACARWGPWRRGAARPYWQAVFGISEVQVPCPHRESELCVGIPVVWYTL